MSRLRAAVALSALALVPVKPAAAQLSPGALSRPHAKLEGSSHCLACHDPREGVAAGKCLACHEPLARRIAAGKGLHAQPGYRDCKTCHVEHQGVGYELVWWGKQGRRAFDHALTGHPLAGKHAALDCAQCHKQKGFLGASGECAACHKDAHRGEFGGRSCSECHSQQAWRPAPGFDHGKTRWPLTGRHAAVACLRCHPSRGPEAAAAGTVARAFRAVAGQECVSCHKDVHNARLGTACASCHRTSGWREVRTTGFDHSRTTYPLTGRHASLACEKCHLPGKPLRLAHASCTDCHRDAHGGELARRADQGRCESCHDPAGFRPALFGPAEHVRTAFPLEGAHLAVACSACHRPTRAGDHSGTERVRLRFASTRCAECHQDPHRGAFARLAGGGTGGCEACHVVASWRQARFDHGRTGFALEGGHARLACTRCHRAPRAGAARYEGLQRGCASCHRDPHAGQFTAADRSVSCERCHSGASFASLRFDHSRDAAYRLDGAHARLACAACHKRETRNGASFVRYKPLPTTCGGCHAGRSATGGRP